MLGTCFLNYRLRSTNIITLFFFTLCVKARRFEREIVDLQDKCKELAQQNEIKSRKIEELTERFYFYFVKGKKIY